VDNIDERINQDLFKTQASTGIATKLNEFWRYQLISTKFNRVMSDEMIKDCMGDTPLSKQKQMGQTRVSKELMVQDFLNPMIGTGED
jgi:hypothetical protein